MELFIKLPAHVSCDLVHGKFSIKIPLATSYATSGWVYTTGCSAHLRTHFAFLYIYCSRPWKANRNTQNQECTKRHTETYEEAAADEQMNQ